MLALAQSMHAFNIANGPVHSAPAIAAARTAWRHPPPGTAGGLFLLSYRLSGCSLSVRGNEALMGW